jgi:hypothetical protein
MSSITPDTARRCVGGKRCRSAEWLSFVIRQTDDSRCQKRNPAGKSHRINSRRTAAACRSAGPRQNLLHDLGLGVRIILHEPPLPLYQFTLL